MARQQAALEAKTMLDRQVKHYMEVVRISENDSKRLLYLREKMDKIKEQELN